MTTDADRIEQLETHLAESRANHDATLSSFGRLRDAYREERAAHERTKAELKDANKDRDSWILTAKINFDNLNVTEANLVALRDTIKEIKSKLDNVRERHGSMCYINGVPCWNCRMSKKLEQQSNEPQED